MLAALYLFLLSCLLSYLLTFSFLPWFSRRFFAIPNSRSLHILPTPTGGGLIFVLIFSLYSLFLLSVNYSNIYLLPLICLPLSVVGFLDDLFELSSVSRFLFQAFTVFPLLATIAFSAPSEFFYLFLILFGMAIINFTNFMDGMDGLVGSCMIITISIVCVDMQLYSYLPVLVGSLFGFLIFNWSPARLFMGDAGSTFLGAFYFGLLLQSSSWSQFFGLTLVAFPLIGDALITLFRRFFLGQNIFAAHRLHLYQRLHLAGWSHSRVTSLYAFSVLLLGVFYLLGGISFVFLVSLFLFLAFFVLDRSFASPFVL